MRGAAGALVGLALAALAPTGGSAQGTVAARTGVVVDDFRFDPGLDFESLRQISVPVVVDWAFSPRGRVTLAGGWSSIRMGSSDGAEIGVEGVVDPEIRLRWGLVPDRVELIATGTLASGTGTVEEEEVALLGPLASDLLGLAMPSLGTGGSVGLGLAGASPAGASTLTWGVYGRLPLTYEPVAGRQDEVRAGAELRLRLGVESRLGRSGSVRAAVIGSFRRQDELNERPVNRVGHRVAGYVSLDVPVGPTGVGVWGSGFYRADPAFEPTAVGAAFVPRGYFVSTGARWTVPVGGRTRIAPELEFRTASSATDATGLELRSLGDLVRVGGRLYRDWNRSLGLVIEAHAHFGAVEGIAASVDARGYRAALSLEWAR